ncbi:TPA: hypothetical protein ACRNS9_004914 [Pseudomonas aeruginosa]
MTTWTSIAEISKEFELAEYEAFPEELRAQLKKLAAPLHPDKNGGEFKGPAEKERYLRIQSAINFVEQQKGKSTVLIPISQLTGLITAISQGIVQTQNNQAAQVNFVEAVRSQISRKLFIPRIGSGAFAAITTFLFAFPEKFEKHVLIGSFLNTSFGQISMLILTFYSGFAFLLTWMAEKNAESAAAYVTSEEALLEIFSNLPLHANSRAPITSNDISRAIQELVSYRQRHPNLPIPFIHPRLELSTLESAANIQIQRLIERGAISKIDRPSLLPQYRINIDIADTMTGGRWRK